MQGRQAPRVIINATIDAYNDSLDDDEEDVFDPRKAVCSELSLHYECILCGDDATVKETDNGKFVYDTAPLDGLCPLCRHKVVHIAGYGRQGQPRTDIINRARAYTFECRRCHKLIKMYAFLRTEKRFCKTCNIQLDAEVAERDRQAKRREVCPNTTAPDLPDST